MKSPNNDSLQFQIRELEESVNLISLRRLREPFSNLQHRAERERERTNDAISTSDRNERLLPVLGYYYYISAPLVINNYIFFFLFTICFFSLETYNITTSKSPETKGRKQDFPRDNHPTKEKQAERQLPSKSLLGENQSHTKANDPIA